MSSQSINGTPNNPPKLCFIASQEHLSKLASLLTKYAVRGWESSIILGEAGPRFHERGTVVGSKWPRLELASPFQGRYERIREALQNPPVEGIKWVICIGPAWKGLPANIRDSIKRGMLMEQLDIPSLECKILNILRHHQLDWKTAIAKQLETLRVDVDRIENWRRQCILLDCEVEGDFLLRNLDIWDERRMMNSLLGCNEAGCEINTSQEADWIRSFDHVVLLCNKPAESSWFIGYAAGKRPGTGDLIKERLKQISEIGDLTPGKRLLIIEDCLLTATEIIRVFEKYATNLIKHETVFRFAVGVNSGHYRLKQIAIRYGLRDFSVATPAGGWIDNLTAEGVEAAQNGAFLNSEGEIQKIEWIIPEITLNNPRAPLNFSRLCTRVGRAIMENVLLSKNWQPKQIAERMPGWSWGFGGLGIATLLPHCAPKPVIPLIRHSAEIQVGVKDHKPVFRGMWHSLIPPTNST